ncbi:hypothetical protein F4823DRAFT_121523 [Ustulina deusta]|nr:hypothetical protein F4823DRAFT_121523 [Ustulina deusta]
MALILPRCSVVGTLDSCQLSCCIMLIVSIDQGIRLRHVDTACCPPSVSCTCPRMITLVGTYILVCVCIHTITVFPFPLFFSFPFPLLLSLSLFSLFVFQTMVLL